MAAQASNFGGAKHGILIMVRAFICQQWVYAVVLALVPVWCASLDDAAATPQERGGVQQGIATKMKYRVKTTSILAAFWMSPDGKWFATGDRGPEITVWDASTGKTKFTVGNASGIRAVAFTPDGKYLIADVSNRKAREFKIKLWSLNDGKEVRCVDTSEACAAICFLPSGNQFAMNTFGEGVQFRDLDSGKLSQTLRPHYSGSGLVGFTGDGKRMVTYSSPGREIKVTDTATGKVLQTISNPHIGNLFNVSLDPMGKYLASGGHDRALHIWDIQSGKLVRTFQYPSAVGNVKWSPDGKWLAVRSGGALPVTHPITICDSTTGEILAGMEKIDALDIGHDFNADGTLLVRALSRYIEGWEITVTKTPPAKADAPGRKGG